VKQALLIALFCAASARAQEEPTPFWMPPPPPKKETKKPAKQKPVQIEPLRMDHGGGEKRRREKPPPLVEKPKPQPKKAPPAQEPRAPEPTWIEPPPRAAEPAPRTRHAPIEAEPEAAPKPRAPAATLPSAPEPSRAPAAPPPPASEPAVVHEPSRPREPSPAPAPARETPAAPAPSISREPARAPARPLEPVPEPAPVVIAEPEPEPDARDARALSVDAIFGAWAKSGSDGGGRAWQLAYGLRAGFAILASLEAEVEIVRAGATAGSPFVSASTTHTLAAVRAFYVMGDRLALLVGGGGGIATAQTHYTLQPTTDLSTPPAGIDSTSVKPVMQITAAARARLFRGLEVRAEVSAVTRDGRLDLLPLLGAGWAF
jgi:hypothetical protein